jgi:hypothetical protein
MSWNILKNHHFLFNSILIIKKKKWNFLVEFVCIKKLTSLSLMIVAVESSFFKVTFWKHCWYISELRKHFSKSKEMQQNITEYLNAKWSNAANLSNAQYISVGCDLNLEKASYFNNGSVTVCYSKLLSLP